MFSILVLSARYVTWVYLLLGYTTTLVIPSSYFRYSSIRFLHSSQSAPGVWIFTVIGFFCCATEPRASPATMKNSIRDLFIAGKLWDKVISFRSSWQGPAANLTKYSPAR